MNKDLLYKALSTAAKELEHNHGWYFGSGGVNSDYSEIDPEFLAVCYKHIHPLLDMSEVNKQRIVQLQARRAALDIELSSLEEQE